MFSEIASGGVSVKTEIIAVLLHKILPWWGYGILPGSDCHHRSIKPQSFPHTETGIPELFTPETAECNELKAYPLGSERPGLSLPLPLPSCEPMKSP